MTLTRYLGILVDRSLKFSNQCQAAAAKAKKYDGLHQERQKMAKKKYITYRKTLNVTG